MKKSGAQSNKSESTYTQKDMERYMGVLSETHNEHLKAMKEGFQIINRKLDGHSKVLDSHTEMIGVLIEDVSILKDDMQVIKRELKKKVDYDEFLSLVRRVNKLEKA